MVKELVKRLVRSSSENEDARRTEFILHVLLLSSAGLFATGAIFNIIVAFFQDSGQKVVSFIILLAISGFFFGLYSLSKRGYSRVSAHVLVLVFLCFAFWMACAWSVDLQSSLLIYALTIVMAGILVSAPFAFLLTICITAFLLVIGHFQNAGVISSDISWRIEHWKVSDTVMTTVIFLIIATVSWLSNREIGHALRRAIRSEAELRRQRDNLEIIVEERTRTLKETQLEKVAQLYRFAEFGRLSSGLFHDLMNPLSAVALNVEKAKSESDVAGEWGSAKVYLDQAFVAAGRMERFIVAVRKQISKEDKKEAFSLVDDIRQVIEILSYKAYSSGVELIFHEPVNDIRLVGMPIRWSQVILNLITNGIDAYDTVSAVVERRDVVTKIDRAGDVITCTVTDHGAGIAPQHIEKVFEPFFTTKAGSTGKGTGIGLSMVKSIIEKDFGGHITVTSTPQQATIFTITLPV